MMQAPNQHAHEYVDLGLPSGTLWATENIKDTNGNELYFAWGETIGYTAEQVLDGKHVFRWNDYKFGFDIDDKVIYGLTKYNDMDGLTFLEPEDDAATQNWGAGWQMPSKEQFEELLAGTTHEWTEVNDIKGLLCTSKTNGNTVFFAAVGGVEDGDIDGVGDFGLYWSDSLNRMNVFRACFFSFGDCSHDMPRNRRYCGYSVRPVYFN